MSLRLQGLHRNKNSPVGRVRLCLVPTQLTRALAVVLLVTMLGNMFLPAAKAQTGTATAEAHVTVEPDIQALINRMPPAQRVGQLFMVTFPGNDPVPDSEIATLIREGYIGGVLLQEANGNFSNQDNALPQDLLRLTNRLQALAFNRTLTVAEALTPTLKSTHPLPPPLVAGEGATFTITAMINIPLFIAVPQEGNGYPYTSFSNGFTPLPSEMALGATWQPSLAHKTGAVVGRELNDVGINMLIGPSLDVLHSPRPAFSGDLGVRTFGGDPYWVGKFGQEFIAGVHEGSSGRVLTVAIHFPGQGSSDRRPDEEVATIAKSLSELRNIELAPFAQVTNVDKADPIALTDALMTAHIRYQGFQGNIRERTPPISLAPQLQEIVKLAEFQPWRQRGGLLISDSLGAQAVRRYEDPELRVFPFRQVAREALLAGNDVLLLSNFGLNGHEKAQMENIRSTLAFFRDKYVTDSEFKRRVDDALVRILRQKLRLYHDFSLPEVLHVANSLTAVGKGMPVIRDVARQAVSLLYPGKEELADRLPVAPGQNAHILFIVDDQNWKPCSTCDPVTLLPSDALSKITLSLYGPSASKQVLPDQIRQLTFSQLRTYLDAIEAGKKAPEAIKPTLSWANWVVLALLHVPANLYPNRDTVSRFLSIGADQLRNKHTLLFAFDAPYYLDATEISKLTAYYALYAKTEPFQEMAVRALFREFVPGGASPVDVPALQYSLSAVTEPDPTQVLAVHLESPQVPAKGEGNTVQLKVGDKLTVATGTIVDHNGHSVPDGTPVVFRFFYPAESLEARHQVFTHDGVARLTLQLDRGGEMWVSVQAPPAEISTQLFINIQGGKLTQVETVVPTPTATPTPTTTPTTPPTPTPTPTMMLPVPQPTPPPPPQKRANGAAWLSVLLSLSLFLVLFVWWGESLPATEGQIVRWSAYVISAGLIAYILFTVGLLPGVAWAMKHLGGWGPLLYALIGAFLPAFIIWVVYANRPAGAPQDRLLPQKPEQQ